MVPFGKQQETSTLFSTADPEELSGNCRETVYEDGLLVISNEKSACVYRSSHVQVDEKRLPVYSAIAGMAECGQHSSCHWFAIFQLSALIAATGRRSAPIQRLEGPRP